MRRKATLSLLLLALPLAAAEEQKAPAVISPAQEYVLAQQKRQEFLEQTPLVQDPVLVGRVRRIGARLAAVSDRPQLPWAFYVAESGQRPQDYQAFALLGGTVVVTRALVELYADDDSLAFALGHEIAHVALKHHLSPVLEEMKEEHQDGRKQLGRWITRFGQHKELEADRYGSLYAVRAGFRFSTAVDSIRELGAARESIREHSDHPDYSERAEQLQAFRHELELSLDRFEKGLAALGGGDLSRAVTALEIFVQQFPSSLAGRVNLGTAHLVRVGERTVGPGGLAEPLPLVPKPGITLRGSYDIRDLWKAKEHYRAAIALDPGSPKALVGLALIALREDDAATAQSLLEGALDRAPEDPEVLLGLGNCRYLAGEHEEAAELYSHALEVRESWAAAERNLALAHQATGSADLAMELWRKLIDHPRYREEAMRELQLVEPTVSVKD